MNKKIKEKAEKAAERYARKEMRGMYRETISSFILERAFFNGIDWYLRNKEKIEEEESLDFYAKLYKNKDKIFKY